MKVGKKVLLLVLVFVMAFSASAFAAETVKENERFAPSAPTLTVSGTTATCRGSIRYASAYIEADLELWQGSTLVASWHQTGTGRVTISETATIVHGITYTLTLSGTVNGVAFTPASITKTL